MTKAEENKSTTYVDIRGDGILQPLPKRGELSRRILEHISKRMMHRIEKMMTCRYDFKAGAQWQKEKDQKELQIAEEHGILTGMNMEHEKLMKDAVVVSFIQDYKYKTPILTGDIKNKFGLTTGQHVKLIIVKDV